MTPLVHHGSTTPETDENPTATGALEDAHRGDAEAQCFVAIALTWFRRAAAQSHPVAPFNLGFLHDVENGVPEDPDEAQRLYALAAVLGHAEVFVQLDTQGTA